MAYLTQGVDETRVNENLHAFAPRVDSCICLGGAYTSTCCINYRVLIFHWSVFLVCLSSSRRVQHLVTRLQVDIFEHAGVCRGCQCWTIFHRGGTSFGRKCRQSLLTITIRQQTVSPEAPWVSLRPKQQFLSKYALHYFRIFQCQFDRWKLAIGDGGLYTLWAALCVILNVLILVAIRRGGKWRDEAIVREEQRMHKRESS